MSVTFWMPQAKTERVQPYPSEPEYWVDEPVAPFFEINMSNSNARAILLLIDPENVNDDGCYGSWAAADLARVRSATIRALNSNIMAQALAPAFEMGGVNSCRMIECGRDKDYVTRRLEQFLALTKVAMDHNMKVQFG